MVIALPHFHSSQPQYNTASYLTNTYNSVCARLAKVMRGSVKGHFVSPVYVKERSGGSLDRNQKSFARNKTND